MLKTLKDLLDRLAPPTADVPPARAEHRLHLATAVMLVEVMRADTTFHPGEREAVRTALTRNFDLEPDEAARLEELAQIEARQANDLFTFTSHINAQFDMAAKVAMIEQMWQVAYADGHLADHERHVLWRVADLLHVPQGAYAHARMRAQAAAAAAAPVPVAGQPENPKP